MKRVAVLLAFTLLASDVLAQAPADFRAKAPPPSAGSKFAPPVVREARLDNGIRLLVVERHELPLVAVNIASDIGSANAPDGVPNLASDIATTATHAHFSWELGTEFQLIGASRDANASLDGAQIALHFLAPRLDRALELAAEVAEDANFADNLVDPDRVVRRDQRHEATRLPVITLANDLFPEKHAFHDLAWGSDTGISRAAPAALDAYWKRAFVANHMTIVVVGDVKLADVLATTNRHFGGIRKSAEGAPPAPTSVAPTPRKAIIVVDEPNAAQAQVAVGTVGVDGRSPDFVRLLLLGNLLAARVSSGTREAHGYTYGMHTTVEGYRGGGLLMVNGAVELGNAGASLRDVFAAATNLSTTVANDEEIARAKTRIASNWASAFETNTSTATQLADDAQLGLATNEIVERNRLLAAITPNDLLLEAQTYLEPKRLHVVVIGNAHDLSAELAPLGLGPVDVRGGRPVAK